MSPRGAAAALVLAAASLGCASAVNYLDPAGPVHVYPREAGAAPPETGAAAAAAPPLPSVPRPWRVVSFNIAYSIEIERALEVLRGEAALRAPDVLALQEMDAPGTERIARALGMNAVYFPSGVHPKHDRDFGCAVMSPWRLEEPRKLVLPHAARVSGLRRAATSAVVVRGSERLRVYSVHLPSPLAISGGSRKAQLRALAGDAAASAEPVVIAGDFNSHGKVEELAKAGFVWVTREAGDTARFRLLGIGLAGLAYDHVLARGLRPAPGDDAVGVVADSRGASDHLPVWAVLVAGAP
ncbi:MAG TPA: endonuclease/exonuclease/phosphatase family protein [Vicinamibacteria bacterium]